MLDKDEQADKARRAEERARRAATKAALHQYLRECGIAIKTPEQKAADILRWQQERAAGIRQIYVPVDLSKRLQTLDQLRLEGGQHGDTLCAYALADCARSWACDGLTRKGNATHNPHVLIHFAMTLHIWQLWRDAGIKNDRLVLDNLNGESRREVEQVIADTFAEWEAADCPGLDAKAVQDAERFIEGWLISGKLEPITKAAPAAAPPYNS